MAACAVFPTGVAGHPRAARNGIVCCCVRPRYGARPTMHCQWDDSAVFRFCPWWPWPLKLTFELGRYFCAVYLTAKFDRPTFSRSEVIVRTNWQSDKNTYTHTDKQTRRLWKHPLRFATLRRWV